MFTKMISSLSKNSLKSASSKKVSKGSFQPEKEPSEGSLFINGYQNDLCQTIGSLPHRSSSSFPTFRPVDYAEELREEPEKEAEPKTEDVAAVVVTIWDQKSSYDNLFRAQRPDAGSEGQLLVFDADYLALPFIEEGFRGTLAGDLPFQQAINNFVTLLREKEVTPDCVVFNFECCGCCSEQGFSEDESMARRAASETTVVGFIKNMIDRGFMVMCSDFSLKALIAKWDGSLGPNPFLQVGTFGSGFELRFDCRKLMDCCSAQLKKVGEMCETDVAQVHAMGGTIIYTVKGDASRSNEHYDLEILTVMTSADGQENRGLGMQEGDFCELKDGAIKGAAGHVLLSYKSGGRLLTSAGHWVELSKLEVSEERLASMQREQYGEKFMNDQLYELRMCSSVQERSEVRQKQASAMIMKNAPCSYKSYSRKS